MRPLALASCCVGLFTGCHAAQPSPRPALPAIDGFVLRQPLGAMASRVRSCNPPADKPPPQGVGRICWGSDSLLLIFDRGDSLAQMQLTIFVTSPEVSDNAEVLWRSRRQAIWAIMGAQQDSLVVKPGFRYSREPDPRGANIRIVRACWLDGPARPWYGNVWVFDEMWDVPKTRATVEVFAWGHHRG